MSKELKTKLFIIIALCVSGFAFTQTTYPKLRLYDNTITNAHKGELQFGMSDVVIENSFGGMDGTLQIKNWGYNGYTTSMTILHNGNIGIGTTAPAAKLSILNPLATNVVTTLGLFGYSGATDNRSMSFQQIGNASTAHQYFFLNGGLGSSSVVGTPTLTSAFAPSFGFECNDNNLNIITSSSGTNVTVKRAMSVSSNGNVGIGTTNVNDANYKLFVETGIRTRKVKVDVAGWADYVFSPFYKLPSLKEVEAFIKQHQHLPDVPSEEQVKKDGLDLGENQAVLLKKIEELTLYIIAQNKTNEDQQQQIEKLKEDNCKIADLKKELESIKKLISSNITSL